MQRGERHLGRPDQIELVLVGAIDVHGLRRQEPRAVHRLLAHEHRRDHRRESLLREDVHRVANERELEQHDVAEQVDEP
jgi:hypothetical protein